MSVCSAKGGSSTLFMISWTVVDSGAQDFGRLGLTRSSASCPCVSAIVLSGVSSEISFDRVDVKDCRLSRAEDGSCLSDFERWRNNAL